MRPRDPRRCRALALVLGSVLLLRGQGRTEMPHGDMKMDCGECHTPERWVPAGQAATFRHDTTGFALQSAHAKASCRSSTARSSSTRWGRPARTATRTPTAARWASSATRATTPPPDEPARDVPGPRPDTLPPLRVHARLDCTACHATSSRTSTRTPRGVRQLPLPTYLGTTSPNHVQAGSPGAARTATS